MDSRTLPSRRVAVVAVIGGFDRRNARQKPSAMRYRDRPVSLDLGSQVES